MSNLRAVIFDYGGVLVHHQPAGDLRNLEALAGLGAQPFNELYWRFRPPYDRGDLDGPGYWAQIGRAAGRTYPAETVPALVAADTASWSHENEPVVRWLGELQRAGIGTAVLSNMGRELSRHVEGLAWARACPVRTYSCDLRHVKPEPEIYRRCLDALGVAPGEALFLDDKPANVEGARAVGLEALLFSSAGELARQVRAMGALPALEP